VQTKANIDAKEIYADNNNTIIQDAKNNNPNHGEIANTIPAAVDTPLPPVKFSGFTSW
jgi:hypothetical protein